MRGIDPTRSHIMRSVGKKRTAPEMVVRRALHAKGYRYRTNCSNLPGSPDIVFTRRRKAIFVHGCFWHRHPGCRHATTPKTRREFWNQKFNANMERDVQAVKKLTDDGWQTFTVWECETRSDATLLVRLFAFLGSPIAMTRLRSNSKSAS